MSTFAEERGRNATQTLLRGGKRHTNIIEGWVDNWIGDESRQTIFISIYKLIWNAPISSSARQHLVDATDVERVRSDAHVERILAAMLHEVLVGADTSGLQRLRWQLLILIRHEVDAERELVYACLLAAQVKDTDLRICSNVRATEWTTNNGVNWEGFATAKRWLSGIFTCKFWMPRHF